MFSKNLKYLRQCAEMEQLELAHKLGRKSSSTISEWESGRYTPKIAILSEIASIFDVDLDDMMNLDLESQSNSLNSHKTKIGTVLKESRERAGFSVKDISDILIKKGFKASEKTIYSWESGNSHPTPDALLEMCSAYQIQNVLHEFGYSGYNDDESIQLNLPEQQLIKKYRQLDQHGQDTVSIILERELERTKQVQAISTPEKDDVPSPSVRIINYYQRLASAGTGQVVFDDVPVDLIEIPDLPEYRNADYAIGVNGDSMEPQYYDGDILLVHSTPDLLPGQFGLFIIDGESYVKKLGDGELISLNPDYSPIKITGREVRIMGRVIASLPPESIGN